MYSKPPNNSQQQTSLSDIAAWVDAASGLMRCPLWLTQQWHRAILDMAARQLALYSEAIRSADTWLRGHKPIFSPGLRLDAGAMDPANLKSPWALVEDYAATRLNSVIALIGILGSEYLDRDDSPSVRVGDALFECVCWLEMARQAIDQQLSQLR